jgi:hypothetical protein
METSKRLVGIFVMSVIAFVGCSKPESPPVRVGGIDSTQLRQAFQDSPAETHRAVDQVLLKVRYHQYPEAIAGLDALTSDAAITEPQKKAITNTIEQVKNVMASPAPGTPQ